MVWFMVFNATFNNISVIYLKLFLLVAFYANVILCTNNMKHKKYHYTAGTIPKFNIKIVENDKIDTSNTQMHDSSVSWIGTMMPLTRIMVFFVFHVICT
jgi:hypothetical protein